MNIIKPTSRYNKPSLSDQVKAMKVKLDELLNAEQNGETPDPYMWRVNGIGERGLRWKVIKLDEQTGDVELEKPDGYQGVTEIKNVVHAPLVRKPKKDGDPPIGASIKNPAKDGGPANVDHGKAIEDKESQRVVESALSKIRNAHDTIGNPIPVAEEIIEDPAEVKIDELLSP